MEHDCFADSAVLVVRLHCGCDMDTVEFGSDLESRTEYFEHET